MQDVHMHRPHATSKPFVDALGAFFPGLQVLMGDIKPAIVSHELLYQVMQRHQFIPEAFTADFQVKFPEVDSVSILKAFCVTRGGCLVSLLGNCL